MPKSSRYLAAVMFTDIEGYTALMQADEHAGGQARHRHRSIVTQVVGSHGGEVVQHLGDGALSVFGSAVDAVTAAVEIQRLANVEPALPLRIGIHSGDLRRDDSGLFGDCVNVASRLEGLAVSGSVLISGKVYDEIKNQRHLSAVQLGEVALKNVLRPVAVWAVADPALRLPSAEEILRRSAWSAEARWPANNRAASGGHVQDRPGSPWSTRGMEWVRIHSGALFFGAILALAVWLGARGLQDGVLPPSAEEPKVAIAVMPFDVFSPIKDDSIFVNGIRDQVQTRLGSLGSLDIISERSAREYAGTDREAGEVARELGVGYLLQGSVSRSGDRVRTTAWLTDANTSRQVWRQDYEADMALESLVTLQGRIAEEVAGALNAEMTPEERQRIRAHETRSLEAYEAYMKGRFFLGGQRTLADLDSAAVAFHQAVAMDSSYAEAFAGLATTYVLLPKYHGVLLSSVVENTREYLDMAEEAATTALRLDGELPDAHTALGWVKLRRHYDWAGAEASLRTALQLDPDHITAHLWYSQLLSFQKRWDDALAEARRAARLDPVSLRAWINLADAHRRARDFGSAIERYESALARDPDHPEALRGIGMAFLWAEEYEAAGRALGRYNELTGGDPAEGTLIVEMIRSWREKQQVIPLPPTAASDPRFTAGTLAWFHAATGSYEGAAEWLARAYVAGDQELLVMGIDPAYDGMETMPEFQDVLDDVGLR